MYSEDEREDHPRSNLLTRICSCLFLYTVGSCRYFGRTSNSLSREDRVELRSLWKSQDSKHATYATEDHWKKKTKKADCTMRKRIRHHFQDHIRKWKDSERPRFPWKMILHFLLVIVVTIQVRIYSYVIYGCMYVATYGAKYVYGAIATASYITYADHCNSLFIGFPLHYKIHTCASYIHSIANIYS